MWFKARESVEILINAGADLNTRDAYGKTPLDLAVEQKAGPDIVNLLQPKRQPVTIATPIPD